MTETALRLPAALAVWGDLFADMPDGNLRLLAALVSALSPLVDKAEAAGARPRGEIDSFSSIGTHGGIDRLLASEWLWRDLAPDEFLRRVAEREALTFEPVHRQAADARTVLVLLDAGPAMLGRPRLVAFAALLCLAASAKARGAGLLWSTNGLPVPVWREALTRADVALLLDRVSPTVLAAAEVDALLEAPGLVPAKRQLPPSLWLVGAGDLPEVALPAGRIAVVERPRLDASGFTVAAHVDVIAASGRTASAGFDLPDEAESTALLRAPFRTTKVRAAPAEPKPRAEQSGWVQSAIAFSADAGHLAVALRDGVLLVSTGPDRRSWRVKLAGFERLVGFEVKGSTLTIATAIRYSSWSRLDWGEMDLLPDQPAHREIFTIQCERDHPLVEPRWSRKFLPFLGRPGARSRFWTLAGDGSPLIVEAEGIKPFMPLKNGTVLKVCERALLIRKSSGDVVASERGSGRTLARFRVPRDLIDGATALDFMEGQGSRWLVSRRADGCWHLTENDDGRAFDVPAERDNERVLGFVPEPDAGDVPAAVTIDPFGDVYIRNEDWEQITDHIEIDDADPPLILAAPGGEEMPVLAAAHLDAEGFVEGFGLARFHAGGKVVMQTVAEWSEESRCLPG